MHVQLSLQSASRHHPPGAVRSSSPVLGSWHRGDLRRLLPKHFGTSLNQHSLAATTKTGGFDSSGHFFVYTADSVQIDNLVPNRIKYRLGPIRHLDLAKNIRQVVFDGFFTEK